MPLPYIQARLGHESITTTIGTYGHLVSDAHEQMSTVIAATLDGVHLDAPAVSARDLLAIEDGEVWGVEVDDTVDPALAPL